MRIITIALIILSACVPPVSPTVDAGDSGRTPCQTVELIGPSRIIRAPDASALSVPCAP